MSRQRKIRELAMQVLFLWDSHHAPDAEMAQTAVNQEGVPEDVRQAALRMATAAWNNWEKSDAWIERLAPQWPPRRQPGVDRNILRLAVWELTHADTPPKVVIDEAIEMAREFSTSQSAAFVNGVLDSVLKERMALMEKPEASSQKPEEEQERAEEPHQSSDPLSPSGGP